MKKTLSVLLVAILVLSLFAACSSTPAASEAPAAQSAEATEAAPAEEAETEAATEAPAAPADPDAPITLRVITQAADALAVLNETAAKFTAANPTVTVEYTVVPGGVAELNQALASKFAANDAADLLNYQWGTQITAFARGGHLMDVTDIGVAELVKPINKPVHVFQGKVYSWPLLQQAWGLLYNVAVAEAAGIGAELPKTVGQFTADMDKIKASGVEYPFIVPAKDGSGATGYVFCYLHQIVSGQNPDFYYQTLTGEKTWDGPEWRSLFELYDRLLQYASPDSLGLDPDNGYMRFARGEGAYMVASPSIVKRIEEMNPDLIGKIQYIPFPLYENEADYATIGDYDHAFSIWSKTPYPEQSIALFKSFYEMDNATAYATAMNGISPVLGTPDASVDPSLISQLPLLEAGKFTGFSEREWVPGIKEIMKVHVQEWMAGTDLETTLAALEADHKRLLDANPEFIDDFMEIRENTVG